LVGVASSCISHTISWNSRSARKRRPPTRTPGAWAVGVFKTSSTQVSVTVSQDKWDKAIKLINDLWDIIDRSEASSEGDPLSGVMLDYKELEITRGFLVHLSMTFEMLTHHLKGFHLALASYLPKRNDEGWKLSDSEWQTYLISKVAKGDITQAEADTWSDKTEQNHSHAPPKTIGLTQHLRDDIYALKEFFDLPKPPKVQARKQSVHLLLYGFADASGGGLGSTVTVPGSGIKCRIGVWGKDEEDESSNFKEFENVVLTIEEEARSGLLQGSSMYLFTDNTTVKGALYKGNTPSRKLFNLIVRFRKVQNIM
jgi:hypothetical protein